ncbi:MAG: peptidoglycan-binding protein [Sedimentibacter sp.]
MLTFEQCIEPNGTYDENTRNAVIAFQTMESLEPTGIVDEQTFNAIVEVYRRQRYAGSPLNR